MTMSPIPWLESPGYEEACYTPEPPPALLFSYWMPSVTPPWCALFLYCSARVPPRPYPPVRSACPRQAPVFFAVYAVADMPRALMEVPRSAQERLAVELILVREPFRLNAMASFAVTRQWYARRVARRHASEGPPGAVDLRKMLVARVEGAMRVCRYRQRSAPVCRSQPARLPAAASLPEATRGENGELSCLAARTLR